MPSSSIILIGFMGCGKSRIARELRKHVPEYPILDMDRWIEKRENMSIPDMFETYGEVYFRDKETELLRELVYAHKSHKLAKETISAPDTTPNTTPNTAACSVRDMESLNVTFPMIISTGGGVILREENRALLRELGTVIWLQAKAETIQRRVRSNKNRPLLQQDQSIEKIQSMLEERKPYYTAAAHYICNNDAWEVTSTCKEILQHAQ